LLRGAPACCGAPLLATGRGKLARRASGQPVCVAHPRLSTGSSERYPSEPPREQTPEASGQPVCLAHQIQARLGNARAR
jgi:hypothetical protein